MRGCSLNRGLNRDPTRGATRSGWRARAERLLRRAPRPVVAGALLLLTAACAFGLPASAGGQLAVAVAMMVALGDSGRRLLSALRPSAGAAAVAAGTVLLAWTLATVIAIALGTAGVLWPRPFLAAVVGTALLALGVDRRRRRSGWVSALARAATRRSNALLALAALAVITAAGAAVILAGALLPPGHFEFDDLSYHLSNVALWHSHGDLRSWKFGYGDPAPAFYPIAGGLASWALLAPFAGLDVLARWTQLPFAFGSLFAVAAVARQLGLGNAGAAVAALASWSAPRLFPALALSAGNDHLAAFAFIAAIEGALALRRLPDRRSLAYLGIALGALAGTKYLGLLLMPIPLAIAALAFLPRTRARDPRVPAPARAAAWVAAAALLIGGYSYLRNFWGTGNPVFPSPVVVAGRTVFAGWSGSSLGERRGGPEAPLDPGRFLWERSDLFGPVFRWTLLPAALLAPVVALRRRRHPAEIVTLLSPALGYLAFVLLLYDHRDIRYLLGPLELSGVAWASLLATLPPRLRTVGHQLSLAGIAIAILAGRPLLIDPPRVLGWALGTAVVVAIAGRLPRRARAGLRAGLAPAAAATLIAIGAGATGSYASARGSMPGLAGAVEAVSGRGGGVIAYAGWNQPYLAFGSRLQNEVHLVPTSRPAAEEFWDWGARPRIPHSRQCCPRRWLRNLAALGVDHVVIVTAGAPPERRWMRGAPRHFAAVAEGPGWELWEVRDHQGLRELARVPRGPRPAA